MANGDVAYWSEAANRDVAALYAAVSGRAEAAQEHLFFVYISALAISAAALAACGVMPYGEKSWAQPSVMNQSITRRDMSKFIANVMKDKGYTVSEEAKNAAAAKIKDYASVGEYYEDARLDDTPKVAPKRTVADRIPADTLAKLKALRDKK